MILLHEILKKPVRKGDPPSMYIAAHGRIAISKSCLDLIGDNKKIVIAHHDKEFYCRFSKEEGFHFAPKIRCFYNKVLVEYLAKNLLASKAVEVFYSETRSIKLSVSVEPVRLPDGQFYYRLAKYESK